ncbi:MAG: hypothetical protein FWB74_01960 [Defluviitaleaceae bacterium]|nr:hypothetical protein [Defluviitaleaceae bacterium]
MVKKMTFSSLSGLLFIILFSLSALADSHEDFEESDTSKLCCHVYNVERNMPLDALAHFTFEFLEGSRLYYLDDEGLMYFYKAFFEAFLPYWFACEHQFVFEARGELGNFGKQYSLELDYIDCIESMSTGTCCLSWIFVFYDAFYFERATGRYRMLTRTAQCVICARVHGMVIVSTERVGGIA